MEITQELIDKYFRYKKESISEEYEKSARYTLESLLEISNRKQPEELSPDIITEYLRLRVDTNSIVSRDLSRHSLKTKMRHVRSYLNWLLGKRHEYTLKFADFYDQITVGEKSKRIVSEKTLKIILRNCSFNYKFLFWLACKIGARRTALCELNIDNLQPVKFKDIKEYFLIKKYQELEVIYGPEAKAYLIIFEDKFRGREAKKEVVIPLYPHDTKELNDYLDKREKVKKKMKKSFEDTKGEYVFWNKQGKRLKPESISRYIWGLSRELGIDFQMHDTRRVAINHWSRLGLAKEIIQKFSGHSTDTIDRYINIDQKEAFYQLWKAQSEVNNQ